MIIDFEKLKDKNEACIYCNDKDCKCKDQVVNDQLVIVDDEPKTFKNRHLFSNSKSAFLTLGSSACPSKST